MDNKKNGIPKLRFPGFTGAWEQRKLGEVMDVGSVKRIHQSDWKTEGVRFLRARDIVSFSKNEKPSDLLYIDNSKYNEYSKISGKVQKGDLLVTGVGSIGVPMLIKSDDPIYFKDGNIIWFKNNNSLNGNFFYYSFTSNKIQNFIRKSSGAGTVGTYTIDNGKKTPILIPKDIDEQEKVGKFLSRFDALIALHQRKLEHLQEQKKGLLQKMFPKNGEVVPEVRFPGFTDAWEQRKLGEVTTRVRGNDGRMNLPTLTISAASGWLDQRERFSGNIAGKEQKNYTLLSEGELSYNHGNSKLAKYGTVFVLRNYKEALVPRVYHSFKADSQTSADFIEYIFSTKRTDRELSKLITSGARMHGLLNINFHNFMSIKINLPLYDEQLKIVKFLREFDSLIALHQRKLDHLELMKKGLLQQMFV